MVERRSSWREGSLLVATTRGVSVTIRPSSRCANAIVTGRRKAHNGEE